jgi:polar amino acid transport system ATP-binding protein
MIIEVDKLAKRVGSNVILKEITFALKRSTLTVMLGSSGSGKSTVLRCLNGLERFDGGTVRVGDVTLTGRDAEPTVRAVRRKIGMVFQQFNLFPHLTALQNVTLAPRVVKGVEVDGAELLRKVGLGDRLNHRPSQLSGGQQQRVAIARALAMEPEVLLFDEPTSALDPALVDEVLNVMRDLKREGMTQVVVTHEIRFAREAADQALFLSEGVVAESGPELLTTPREPVTREFLKKYL